MMLTRPVTERKIMNATKEQVVTTVTAPESSFANLWKINTLLTFFGLPYKARHVPDEHKLLQDTNFANMTRSRNG